MNFLINGGHFLNNGAQSMLMITVSELNKRFPNCKIFVNSPNDYLNRNKYNNFKFEIICLDYFVCDYFDKGNTLKMKIRNFAKSFFKNKISHNRKQLKNYEEILKNIDIAIDISGYVLSSQWGEINSRRYLQILNVCDKFNIDYYIFPQSIGPFDYKNNKEELYKEIKRTLERCKIVMPREPEGYELLEKMGLSNLKLANDIVLQNKKIDVENLYWKIPDIRHIKISGEHNVAIIPNMRNYDHGNLEDIDKMYKSIIDYLLMLNKKIYLISHTQEDSVACNRIKKFYVKNNNVLTIMEELDCFSFGYLIQQFEFAIASRFHSIIHSYKENVPCIALGWATKYKNLLNLFDQEQYIFDVRYNESSERIIAAIDLLNTNLEVEKIKIKEKLEIVQSQNIFDIIKEK